MWFIGVDVEQETSAPPPKKKSWVRPCKIEQISNPMSTGLIMYYALGQFCMFDIQLQLSLLQLQSNLR